MDIPYIEFIVDAVRLMDEQMLPREGRMVKMNEQQLRALFLEVAPNIYYPPIPPEYFELIICGYLYKAERNDGLTGVMVFGVQIAIDNSIMDFKEPDKSTAYDIGVDMAAEKDICQYCGKKLPLGKVEITTGTGTVHEECYEQKNKKVNP